jgi:hypothetical protein
LHVMGAFALFSLVACVVALIVASAAGVRGDELSRTGSK